MWEGHQWLAERRHCVSREKSGRQCSIPWTHLGSEVLHGYAEQVTCTYLKLNYHVPLHNIGFKCILLWRPRTNSLIFTRMQWCLIHLHHSVPQGRLPPTFNRTILFMWTCLTRTRLTHHVAGRPPHSRQHCQQSSCRPTGSTWGRAAWCCCQCWRGSWSTTTHPQTGSSDTSTQWSDSPPAAKTTERFYLIRVTY